MEKLRLEFNTNVEDVRECVLVNKHVLIDPEICPEEDYYIKCEKIFQDEILGGTEGHISFIQIAHKISEREEYGMNLAMRAFTIGHIMAMGSPQQKAMVSMLVATSPFSRTSEVLQDVYQSQMDAYGSATLSSIITLFYLSTILVIMQELQCHIRRKEIE